MAAHECHLASRYLTKHLARECTARVRCERACRAVFSLRKARKGLGGGGARRAHLHVPASGGARGTRGLSFRGMNDQPPCSVRQFPQRWPSRAGGELLLVHLLLRPREAGGVAHGRRQGQADNSPRRTVGGHERAAAPPLHEAEAQQRGHRHGRTFPANGTDTPPLFEGAGEQLQRPQPGWDKARGRSDGGLASSGPSYRSRPAIPPSDGITLAAGGKAPLPTFAPGGRPCQMACLPAP
jgi:hypothetical protein